MAETPVHVLFVDTTEFFGPMAQVHTRIMRHLDPEAFRLTVLANSAGESKDRLSAIPNLETWTQGLGRRIHGRGLGTKIRALADNAVLLLGLPGTALRARRTGVDIVHAGMTPRSAIIGMALAWGSGAKLVLHVHENPPVKRGMRRRFLSAALRRADAVITVSGYVRDTVVGMGVPPERVWPFLNTMDLGRFHPDNSGLRIRLEYGIPVDSPLVLCLGRIFPGKGQADLVHAMRLVHAEAPSVRALIVGWEDKGRAIGGKSYRRVIEEYCQENGLADVVTIDKARPDAPDLMAAADIFAAPFTNDAGPLTILEAMASGKAIVAYRTGGIPEQVDDHGAILVEPKDEQALARGILALAADPALRREMGERNRRRVEKHFYEARLAEDVTRVYETILGRPLRKPMRLAA